MLAVPRARLKGCDCHCNWYTLMISLQPTYTRHWENDHRLLRVPPPDYDLSGKKSAQVFRGFRKCLNMDRPEHHSIDGLTEGGAEKGSGRHSTLQLRERSVFNLTNICTVSRAIPSLHIAQATHQYLSTHRWISCQRTAVSHHHHGWRSTLAAVTLCLSTTKKNNRRHNFNFL